jgi:SNF2 family DNA or RNA helicase
VQVLITTYEMVVTDTAQLSRIQWECLIVDEAHRLKNVDAKLSVALRKFSIGHCILLTGA